MRITLEQEEQVVRLYRSNAHTIKEIMHITGVRSEQTIYRILASRNIELIRVRKPVRKVSINFDHEVEQLVKKANPNNLSKWVCDMIKLANNYVNDTK